MEKRFEKLIDFTLRKEGITGRTRVLFLSADQWKKFVKEKNDLAIQYELLTKKSSALSTEGKEEKKRADYSTSLTTSIKEPKKRFNNPEAKQKFPHMAQLCLMNCDVDILIITNPLAFSTLSSEKQGEAIVQEILHYEEHRAGKLYPAHQLAEKAKKIVGEFLKQVR
jgi:hypothetical protein